MRPNRNFRFRNKKEAFVLVGFRYDESESLEYIQRVKKESIVEAVSRLLSLKGADVISIRRVYLDPNEEIVETQIVESRKPQEVLVA